MLENIEQKKDLYNRYCNEIDIQILELYTEKKELQKRLDEILITGEKLTAQKIRICKEVTGHNMVLEQEVGMYGDTYYKCSLCGYNN